MTINYTDLLDEDIRNIVTVIEDVEAFGVTLETNRILLINSFHHTNAEELIGDIQTTFDGYQSTLNSFSSSLIALATSRLSHRETVLEQLGGLTSSSITDILLALVADMVNISEIVTPSVVTLGTVVESKTNANAGTLILTNLLSGSDASGASGIINRFSGGWDNQFSINDTVTILCTSSVQGTYGNDTFTISGIQPSLVEPFENNPGGTPGTTSVSPGDGAYIIGFDAFTANLPDNWTEIAGVAGTDYGSEATKVMHGSIASLFLDNDAELQHPIYALLNEGETSVIHFSMLKEAGATGDVIVNFVVDGVTVGTVTVDVSTLSDTVWGLQSLTITNPIDFGLDDDDVTTYLAIVGDTLSAKVYIDNFNWMPFTYFGGVGVVVALGQDPFLVDDLFTFTIENDDAGQLQRFFTRAYGVQLPTDLTPPGTTLGAEQITNGTFDNATGWTLSIMEVTGGELREEDMVAAQPKTATHDTVTFLNSKTWRVTFDVNTSISGTWNLQFNGVTEASFTTIGTKTFDITPAGTGTFRFQTTIAGASVNIDNVSIKEVL